MDNVAIAEKSKSNEQGPSRGVSNVDSKGFDFEFISFGDGRRICPGISFGVSKIELALSQLLYHFDWQRTNGIQPDQLDMSETSGVTFRRIGERMICT
ncbi:hypothetical protein M0R45_033841 [Rubus argutus]|uniref:Cytochrome P450 n=1 Tax=Rubus argutus TaxID=59490 RepID=A0AAW1WNF7_RUBAR